VELIRERSRIDLEQSGGSFGNPVDQANYGGAHAEDIGQKKEDDVEDDPR